MRAARVACAFLLVAVASLPLVAAAPEQVHVGLRDGEGGVGYAVSWTETDPTAPRQLTLTGPEADTIVEARVVPGPAPGIVLEARLPPLAPNATYSYTIGARNFSLATPPAQGSTFRVALLGDMGTTREAGATVQTLQAEAPGLVLHVGDISYAGGDPVVWKTWFDLVEPVASRVPWVPALGNHEGDVLGVATDEAALVDPSEQAHYRQRFPTSGEKFWYSFDWGGVHFVALDTFSALTMPPEELAWLEQDLAAAKDADWIVAYLHEPPYSSNAAHGSSPRAHAAFADILEKGGVSLVVSGHDHAYERTHVLRGGEVVSAENRTLRGTGTTYVVSGGAGAPLYKTFVEPPPTWSASRSALHHVLLLEVGPEALRARVVPTTGDGFADAFEILARAPEDVEPARTPAPGLALLLGAIALALRARPRA